MTAWGGEKKREGRVMGERRLIDRHLTWGSEHTIQYTDEMCWNCAPKTYIVLLTSATTVNSIKIKILSLEIDIDGWQI